MHIQPVTIRQNNLNRPARSRPVKVRNNRIGDNLDRKEFADPVLARPKPRIPKPFEQKVGVHPMLAGDT